MGHFLLTKELFPLLLAEKNARIVTVTSYYHHNGKIDFENLNSEKGYNYAKAYANSKLAQIMFSFELERRIREAGLSLTSVAVHPGSVKSTMLYRYEVQDILHLLMRIGEALFGQSPKEGALPSIYASTAPGVEGGSLYGPDKFFEIRGNPTKVAPAPEANNTLITRQLWEYTEMLLGEKFDMEIGFEETMRMAI